MMKMKYLVVTSIVSSSDLDVIEGVGGDPLPDDVHLDHLRGGGEGAEHQLHDGCGHAAVLRQVGVTLTLLLRVELQTILRFLHSKGEGPYPY